MNRVEETHNQMHSDILGIDAEGDIAIFGGNLTQNSSANHAEITKDVATDFFDWATENRWKEEHAIQKTLTTSELYLIYINTL